MVRIIGDTTSGFTLEQAKELGIEYIPQIIIFGDQSYRDDTEMDSAMFAKKLAESKDLPKTAAPPPALYTPIYEDMQQKGEPGIVICPSSELSGTVRSATTALQDFPGLDVRVIDTRLIGSSQATLLKMAKQASDEGKTVDEIEDMVRTEMKKAKIYGVVDTLEYLHRGGRIGGASKFFGELLQIKPLLTVIDGKIDALEKQRTKKKAMARLLEIVEEGCNNYPDRHFSFSSLPDNPENGFLKKEFKERFGIDDLPFLNIPPGIMVHAGPNTIILSYFSE